jgi:hypothetical protein
MELPGQGIQDINDMFVDEKGKGAAKLPRSLALSAKLQAKMTLYVIPPDPVILRIQDPDVLLVINLESPDAPDQGILLRKSDRPV